MKLNQNVSNNSVNKLTAARHTHKIQLALLTIALCLALLSSQLTTKMKTLAIGVQTPKPSVTPNNVGKGRLTFASNKEGTLQIYTMEADGTNLVNLTNNKSKNYAPAWSPDGQKIAFTSDRDGEEGVYIMGFDGNNLKRLTENGRFPTWSPDGKKLAFESNREGQSAIYIISSDGTDLHRLTDGHASDVLPAWSPDGKYIAFTSFRGTSPEIFVMDTQGSNIKGLTFDDEDWYPSWAPDSKHIVYQRFLPNKGWNIFVMGADGTNKQCITCNTEGGVTPKWSPDGNSIVFIDGDKLCFMTSEGENNHCIQSDTLDQWSLSWTL